MEFVTGILSALLVAGLIGLGMWYFGTVHPFRSYDDPKRNWNEIEKTLDKKENNRG
jgi:hypothetical protein